jgi:hypothetical protein
MGLPVRPAGLWQGAKVAIKFVVSDSLNSNSVTLRESLLGQLLRWGWTRCDTAVEPACYSSMSARLLTCASCRPGFTLGASFPSKHIG